MKINSEINQINFPKLLKNESILFKKQFMEIFSLYFFFDKSSLLELSESEKYIFDSDYQKIFSLTKKKVNNEDITFLINKKYFYNIKLFLEKGVFVPQYDTEGLVDLVLKNVKEKSKGLEIGVGSGAIMCSLLKNKEYYIKGIDINNQAISLTKKNLNLNKINKDNYILENKDFFNMEFEKFDFIVTNPPYISFDDKNVSEWVKNNQPSNAIYESDIKKFYFYLIENSKKLLNKNGIIFFELDINIKKIIEKKYNNFLFYKDLNNQWRYGIYKNETGRC